MTSTTVRGGPWNRTHPEHPLKTVSGRNSVENAAIRPLPGVPAPHLLARSNRRGAGRGSTSGARARGFRPLLWSRGPRSTTGLRSHTPLVGLCGVVGGRECRRADTPCAFSCSGFSKGSLAKCTVAIRNPLKDAVSVQLRDQPAASKYEVPSRPPQPPPPVRQSSTSAANLATPCPPYLLESAIASISLNLPPLLVDSVHPEVAKAQSCRFDARYFRSYCNINAAQPARYASIVG